MGKRTAITSEQSKVGRPTLATPAKVLEAIRTLEEKGQVPSVRKIMQITGGATNTISDVLSSLPQKVKPYAPQLILKDAVAKALDSAWKSSIEEMQDEYERRLSELNDQLTIANAVNLRHERERLDLEKVADEKNRQFDQLNGQYQREKESQQITRSALDDARRRLGVLEEGASRDKAEILAGRESVKKLERQLELTAGELQMTKDVLHDAEMKLATTKLRLEFASAKERAVVKAELSQRDAGTTDGGIGDVDQNT